MEIALSITFLYFLLFVSPKCLKEKNEIILTRCFFIAKDSAFFISALAEVFLRINFRRLDKKD